MNLYSYVVRYDSGFAPNPFYEFCTLATCKPGIRKTAQIGDWVVGFGSASQEAKQKGKMVYAMKVCEILLFNEYFSDDRFQSKKPILTGSKKQARGDNIYTFRNNFWKQLDSFHSEKDGSPSCDHIKRDTKVDRVLISEEFIYFGKYGPAISDEKFQSNNKSLCHSGRNYSKFCGESTSDRKMILNFEKWYFSFKKRGFVNNPFDWDDTQ